jgi:hypothetical protein
MITSNDPTVLRLEGMGVPPYSARGLSQTLEPIDAQQHIVRTINGNLLDLGYEPFQKYKSTISGKDVEPPACDGVWAGKVVFVDCIVELSVQAIAPLGRDPVDYDAVRVVKGFTIYRPRLVMMVFHFSLDQDEYGRAIGWKLDLEEV